MIMLWTAQVLRAAVQDPICEEWIQRAAGDIEGHFKRGLSPPGLRGD